MKILLRHLSDLMVVALFALVILTLLSTVPAFAQEVPGGEALAPLFWAMMFVAIVPAFIYYAVATQVIARKTSTAHGWLAWIPIANLILWANIARRPVWWGLLCIVPLANLVFTVLLWMAIAEARKKPGWWGILMIVPVVNLIVPGYLAWAD